MALMGIYRRVRYLLTQFSLGNWGELSRVELLLVYPVRLLIQVFRELVQDRGLVRASSLAFTTVLSIVPVLTVATTLMTAFGSKEGRFMTFLQETFLPFAGPEMTEHIQTFVTNQSGAISGFGAVILILLGAALFNNIEHAFNDIWRVRKRRPLVNKFLTFYALITLAPLLITLSIVQSAKLQLMMGNVTVPFFASVSYQVVPILLGTILFMLANKLLPYTRVSWIPALISGFVTAVAFELGKAGFNFYINEFVLENYSAVYGAIGLVPIFLVWVYLCWVIVLFGAELTYTIQNLKTLLLPQRLRELAKRRERHFSPLIAIEVFAPVAAAFKAGDGPARLSNVAAVAGVPLELTRSVLEDLKRKEIVLEMNRESEHAEPEYYPARPLDDIPLLEILYACRTKNDELDDMPFISSLRGIYKAREEEMLGELTGAALVSQTGWERARALMPSLAAAISGAKVNRGGTAPTSHAEQVKRALGGVTPGLDSVVSPIDALADLSGTDTEDAADSGEPEAEGAVEPPTSPDEAAPDEPPPEAAKKALAEAFQAALNKSAETAAD